MNNQIMLPPNIYNIYNFFEKTNDIPLIKVCDIYHNLVMKTTQDDLNFYRIDLKLHKNITPSFIIKYLRNIDYRNIFSSSSINFKQIGTAHVNSWVEEETYNNTKTIFSWIASKFQLISYVNKTSDTARNMKYYNCYKILKDNITESYILRFESVYNNMDMDQDIDISIYLHMIINILKSTYNILKIPENEYPDYFKNTEI
jgi:hypothetical protein